MRDILVRARTLDRWDDAVTSAARVAAMFRGTLTAMHVVPVAVPAAFPYDPGMLAAVAAMETGRQVAEAEQCSDRFIEWARSSGVLHPVWMASSGDVAYALDYVAGWHDLLVACSHSRDDDPWTRPSGVGRIVVATRLPTLVLPPASTVDQIEGTVAVAWNDTPGSARALHSARAFVQRARRVVVLVGAHRAPSLRRAFQLEDWLQRHRPDAEVRELGDIGDGGDPTGAALLSAARQERADLLVMGAYGRTRFSEWVLGGVTRHVLECADLPLLMRH